MLITHITISFIALAYNFMGTVTFTTTPCHLAITIFITFLVALQEMRALTTMTAPRETFKIEIAVIAMQFLPMQTYAGMDA